MEKPTPLQWYKDGFYISIILSAVSLSITVLIFLASSKLSIGALIITALLVIVTYFISENRCPHCRRIFCIKKISDELIKEWTEPKRYNEQTIYYYNDGSTQKDVKIGATRTFLAKYEQRKLGFDCKKCGNTHFRDKTFFVNEREFQIARESATKKIVTKESVISFNPDLFTSQTYETESGKRKTIPKGLRYEVWTKRNGNNWSGKCFVCKNSISHTRFHCGHIIPASRGGKDILSNLEPICVDCNLAMGNRNLYEFKKEHFSDRS